MTKAFVITVEMADEIFGPDQTLTLRHTIHVPNGTTYADAYTALEHELKMLCARMMQRELAEREQRGQLVDRRRLQTDEVYRREAVQAAELIRHERGR